MNKPFASNRLTSTHTFLYLLTSACMGEFEEFTWEIILTVRYLWLAQFYTVLSLMRSSRPRNKLSSRQNWTHMRPS